MDGVLSKKLKRFEVEQHCSMMTRRKILAGQ
jgi:hypothetical protein